MQKRTVVVLLLLAVVFCSYRVFAETIDVRLRIRQEKTEEKIITRENLIKIQQFILMPVDTKSHCELN